MVTVSCLGLMLDTYFMIYLHLAVVDLCCIMLLLYVVSSWRINFYEYAGVQYECSSLRTLPYG